VIRISFASLNNSAEFIPDELNATASTDAGFVFIFFSKAISSANRTCG